MREVQVSRFISAEIDHDHMRIDDELEGTVTLDESDIQALFTEWIRQGGLKGESGADLPDDYPQGLRGQDGA